MPDQERLTALQGELAGELAAAGWSDSRIARALSLTPAVAALLPAVTALQADLAAAVAVFPLG